MRRLGFGWGVRANLVKYFYIVSGQTKEFMNLENFVKEVLDNLKEFDVDYVEFDIFTSYENEKIIMGGCNNIKFEVNRNGK